ncbi:MAG: c-type cytochrome biogenesis protein CcmI, partial [Pseudolabrys sp.]
MTLWLILALMTGAAIFAVIWPLAQNSKAARSGSDVAVYRDQLNELERDLAAGSIGKTEAEAARVEISRRLLAAADAAKAAAVAVTPSATPWHRRAVALVALLLLPVGAGSLYLRLGSPGLASEPLTAQRGAQPDQQAPIENIVAKVEVHLQNNPKDGRGWEVLAPVYMQLGRYTDSVNAWRNALALLGESADREANLGEALVAEANGVVTADAKAAFVRAVTLDNTTVSARYYLGTAAEQDGKREEAAKIWRDLIAEAPAGAHWVSDVRAALARVEASPAALSPGPSAAQIAAATKQSPDQQTAMIRGMVDGLAARLQQDGSDLDGWVRLVRSYKVLGELDKEQSAIGDAQRALANDPEKRKRFDVALKELESGAAVAAVNPPVQQANPPTAPPQHEGPAIQSMLDRLAERVKRAGSDTEGWVMLTRSYLTLGEKEKAAAAIKDARAALADDAARLQQFNEALQRFKINEIATVASAMPSPPATESRASAQPSDQTNEMIRGMVARLADRLKRDGSDFDGWLQLMRSYVVLGERDKAMRAAADARQAIGSDADKRRRFDDFVKSLGLD